MTRLRHSPERVFLKVHLETFFKAFNITSLPEGCNDEITALNAIIALYYENFNENFSENSSQQFLLISKLTQFPNLMTETAVANFANTLCKKFIQNRRAFDVNTQFASWIILNATDQATLKAMARQYTGEEPARGKRQRMRSLTDPARYRLEASLTKAAPAP